MSDLPSVQVTDDDHIIYRASSLGYCITRLAAARQQLDVKPPPAKMQEIFDAGLNTEEQFHEMFPSAITNRQVEITLPITKRLHIHGHIDGLHQGRIAEIKSQSDDMYDSWTPDKWLTDPLWIGYTWQVSAYMIALGKELALFRVKRSDVEQFQVWVVERPFYTLDDIRERILEVESLATEDKLSCTLNSWGCPYPYLHVEHQIVEDEGFGLAVADFIKARDDEKYAKLVKEEARKQIEVYFSQLAVNKLITTEGIKVSRSEFDRKEKVIPAGREVRVTVTVPKGTNNG